jgi:hypothetical protein
LLIKHRWNSTTLGCATCVAAALPATIPGHYPREQLTDYVERGIVGWCATPHTIGQLAQVGSVITAAFESPVLFYNITLLAKPITSQSRSMNELMASPKSTDDSVVARQLLSMETPRDVADTSSDYDWRSLPASADMIKCSSRSK